MKASCPLWYCNANIYDDEEVLNVLLSEDELENGKTKEVIKNLMKMLEGEIGMTEIGSLIIS